jgi:hypothetical protein
MAAKKLVVAGKSKKAEMVKAPTAKMQIREAVDSVTTGFRTVAALLSQDLKPAPLAIVYQAIDKDWKKVIEGLRAEARAQLLALAEEQGEQQDNGCDFTLSVQAGESEYVVTKRAALSKMPDADRLRELCAQKGIAWDELTTPVVTYTLDPLKLDLAVSKGLLTRADVEACRKAQPVQLLVSEAE